MTQALFTSMTGLNAGTEQLTVVSDNVANMNTTAYKTSRVDFQDVWYQTKNTGTKSTRNSGGINPYQIGVGVKCASISKDFNASNTTTTGRPTDLAITGDGWFTVLNPDGEVLLTRDGTFSLDENGFICTADGCKLLGTGADASLVRSTTPTKVPTMIKVVETPTESDKLGEMWLDDLNSLGSSNSGVSGGKFKVTAFDSDGAVLKELEVDLGEDLSVVNVNGLVSKLNDGSEGQYTAELKDGYIAFTPADGVESLRFESFTEAEGGSNFISVTDIASATKIDGSYNTKVLNMSATISEIDDITSDSTHIYDSFSIGNDGLMTITYGDGSSLSIKYTDNGTSFFSYTDANGVIINDDINNTGEASLYVDPKVIIKPNMQIQLAKATNNYGLVAMGNNRYRVGPDTGAVIYTAAGVNGVGGVASGALEASNVDLAQQFSYMILAQRLVQANSRVFSGANSMLETLVYLGQ